MAKTTGAKKAGTSAKSGSRKSTTRPAAKSGSRKSTTKAGTLAKSGSRKATTRPAAKDIAAAHQSLTRAAQGEARLRRAIKKHKKAVAGIKAEVKSHQR
ncbi:MAG TPA: hypothetical protein VNB91_15905, partial [Jatrophihabitantaceae bacterium]|nr:hypothetical protein [Jatrophihabitantaceae bacterium]